MNAYNTSSAHAIPAVLPEKRQPVTRPVIKHRYRIVEKQNDTSILGRVTFKTIVLFFAVIGVICYMLYNQARLNEVNEEINQTQRSIVQLESEYVRMQSSLESSLSLRSVAKYAEQELGLQHLDQYQIEYVCIYEDDRIEILTTREPESFSDQVESFVGSIVGRIQGVFGG